MEGRYSAFKRISACICSSFFFFATIASAQIHTSFVVASGNNTTVSNGIFNDPACPPYSGPLSAISVPVNGSVNLFIEINAPQTMDLVYTLSSANAQFVVAGSQAQGFLPQVTIPAGSIDSNPFTIYGVTVGATTIDANLNGVGLVLSVPVTAWGLTNTTGSTQLLDANSPSSTCIDPNTGMVSTSNNVLSSCGKPVKGVASDGTNPLLLRTEAGLAGTACFDITSSGSNQGKLSVNSYNIASGSGTLYGFSVYTPPDGYGTDGTDSRQVSIQFAFTPAGGTTNTTTIPIMTNLVRPPLVLIHGLWAHGSDWNNTYTRQGMSTDAYTVYPADYASTNAASFTTNQTKVQGFVKEALRRFRTKQYAGAQVDVIGHSMGGILTRLYTALPQLNTLKVSDIHRLVTLDTPHIGTNFANLLVALHATSATVATAVETTVTNLTKGSMIQGAVCDLAQNSSGLQLMNSATNIPGQFFTGTGGPAGTATTPAKYWGGATFAGFSSFESALTARQYPIIGPFIFPQATVDAFRFREMNDAVVPLSSQQGGLTGTTSFPDLHMHIPSIPGVTRGITDDDNAAHMAFNTLDGPSTGLSNPLPGVGSTGNGVSISPVPGLGATTDAANYTSQCGAGGPMRRSSLVPPPFSQTTSFDPRITVTSPSAGTVFNTTDTLSITVSVASGLTVVGYGVNIPGIGRLDGSNLITGSSGTTFQASVTLNAFSVGPLTILPEIYDNLGNLIEGTPITVVEKYTSATVTSASLVDRDFLSLAPGTTQQLYLMGTYSDGSQFDISSGLLGTNWVSSNPSVLTVDANGNVTTVAPGIAAVTAKNGAFTDFASFVVQNAGTTLPPADFTSQISIQESGIRLNRTTGFFVQTVTLTNTSGIPLPGPLYLIVSGLPQGISLIGINGVTTTIAPVGSGYFTLPLTGGSLTMPPGQPLSLQFQFLDPGRVPPSYSLNVVWTSDTP